MSGKRPTLKTKIRRFLNEDVGSFLLDGMPINREDRMLMQAIEDAEMATEPIDRHRALNIVLDRLYGKAVQPTDNKYSGSLDLHHTFTGKRWEELSKDELTHVIANPDKYREQDGMLLAIPEAEYEVIESINSTEAGTNNITVVPSED
jgi:hypothetical protein